MPTVRLTWGDPNNNEEGHRVYRDTAPLDTANPENLPEPLAELTPDLTTYDDETAEAGTTYYYAVAAYKGDFVNVTGEIEATTPAATGPDFAAAQIGDYIGGGIYAGKISISGAQYYLVGSLQSAEVSGISWSTSSSTTGANDARDGLANQQIIEGIGLSGFPAFQHCADYSNEGLSDWYLPAHDEMALIESNLVSVDHPEFSSSLSDVRWLSTESSSGAAGFYRLSNGYSANVTKTAGQRVRPVRRVEV